MNTLWQNLQYKMLRSDSKLNLLIGINIIVFLLINVGDTIGQFIFRTDIVGLYAGDYLHLTAFLPRLVVRFWTPFTYMFMHAGVFHILFNMLWLYWFGQIFEEYLGHKRTLGLYIMGGLAGAFLFVLSFNTLPFYTHSNAALNSSLVGASASVMAIMVATATLLPDYTISLILIGPVKLKWLVAFFIVIDFLGIVGPNGGGEIAHMGGGLIGFIYIKQLQKGKDWIGSIIGVFKPKPVLTVVSKNNSIRNVNDLPRQEEIDHILDKISQSGYKSLSKQEKETLFRASKDEG